jgi:hypothetical protein
MLLRAMYMFEALEDSTGNDIVQPVLEWGFVCGVSCSVDSTGGQYWSLSCWYLVSDSFSFESQPEPVDVTTGQDTVNMYIHRTSNGNGTYQYTCFNGYSPNAPGDITDTTFAQGIEFMPRVYEAFESDYRDGDEMDSECYDYPDQDSIAMKHISLRINGSYPTLIWAPPTSNPDTTCGQYTVVVDSANSAYPSPGEVDFYMFGNPITGVELTRFRGHQVRPVHPALTDLTPST